MSNYSHYHKNSKSSYNDSDIPCRISFNYDEYQPATITGIKTNHAGEIVFVEVKVQETIYKVAWKVNKPARHDIAIIVEEELLA